MPNTLKTKKLSMVMREYKCKNCSCVWWIDVMGKIKRDCPCEYRFERCPVCGKKQKDWFPQLKKVKYYRMGIN